MHHAVLKGVEGKTSLLIDFARQKQKMSEEKVMNWIDAKTDDELWTPLHYGSFSGNLDAVYVLLENGARMEELNS